MALTANLLRTGRAGASDLADIREYIASAQEVERKRVKALTMELVDFIAVQLGDKYQAWWETTPDDNEGFLAACQAKVAELQSQPSPIDEAQAIERSVDAILDVSESWQADAIADAEFDADTKWTQECAL